MSIGLALFIGLAVGIYLGAGIGHYQRQIQERDERKKHEENGEWQ